MQAAAFGLLLFALCWAKTPPGLAAPGAKTGQVLYPIR